MFGNKVGHLGRVGSLTLAQRVSAMFSRGEPGAWYDPSDMSTLFQDSAGTTPVTAVEQYVGLMLDKSGRGNHAIQATTMKRPLLSRRVNLALATEDASSANWVTPLNATVSSASAVGAPLVSSLWAVTETVASAAHAVGMTIAGALSGGTYTISYIVKAGARTWARIFEDSGSSYAYFNLTTGEIGQINNATANIISLGNGFYRCSLTYVQSGTVLRARLGPALNNGVVVYAGDGGIGLYVSGLQIEPGPLTSYQWVNTATDYDADPAKFPAYRRLDGVDDSHASATGGGGNAGFFFSASVSPQGGAGTARTLFSDAGTNTGYIVRLNASNQLELAAGNGTTYTTIATAGTLAVGSTDIVQAWDDGTNLNVKIGNGPTASIARPTVSAGTAGYTMGQDNGASTGYFNGRLYSTIYRKDSGLTQVQRESVALYQRQKARMP